MNTPMTSNVQIRAEQLDTIAAVLPMNRRDMLAEILTDEDVETLRHLVNEGIGENTLRARSWKNTARLSSCAASALLRLAWPWRASSTWSQFAVQEIEDQTRDRRGLLFQREMAGL